MNNVDIKRYLKKCGFKEVYDKDGRIIDVTLDLSRSSAKDFYPSISCIMRRKRVFADGKWVEDYSFVFVLHFNHDVDSIRSKLLFSWNDKSNVLLKAWKGEEIADCFTIRDSLLQKVQNSRSKSAKPWKKKNYPIDFSRKFVYNIFEVEKNAKLISPGANDDSIHNKPILDAMRRLEEKAAINKSLQYFNAWYDLFLKLKGKRKLTGNSKTSSNQAFLIFKKKVEALQNG